MFFVLNRPIAIAIAVSSAAITAHAAGIPGQGTWQTALQARDLDHDGATDAYYDTVLDLTWLADWNLAKTSGYDTHGLLTWNEAVTWASTLDFAGHTGWRLPTMLDIGNDGCNFSVKGGTDCGHNVKAKTGSMIYSEMAHLYYTTLGNKSFYQPATGYAYQQGYGLTNAGEFQNLQGSSYWAGLSLATDQNAAWKFTNYGSGNTTGEFSGLQSPSFKSDIAYAVAVHSGDVVAVPEPETSALMLLGFAAVTVATRRRSRQS